MEEIHLFTLFVVGLVIVYSDFQAFLYLIGKKRTLVKERVHLEHRVVWTALMVMIGTGLLLLFDEGVSLLLDGVFLLKMLFVVALVLNARAIGTLAPLASEKPFAQLDAPTKRKMVMSGAISSVAWAGAAIIGLFFL
ncbi:MAG: hypothetical protein KBE09_03605 [Candidatus Pacebacteria bacterium]|nr:hypothetical protein [Candidatus Paceibacterota bacterium]